MRRRIGSGAFATVWLAYDEHLDFLCFHPGFEAEVMRLRAADRLSSEEIDRVAGKWAMTASDLRRFVDAEGGDVTLEPMADKVLVEIGATEYLVHIPRPLTPALREAVTRWLRDAGRWPRLLQDERGEGLGWRKPRSAHPAPTAREYRKWYARWNAGESVREIYRSLPDVQAGRWESTAFATPCSRSTAG